MKTRIIKDLIKRVVDYRIEGDYHVYTVKNTPLTIRILMTKKYNRKWAGVAINPRKIIFDNYMGSSYGCNGKYITEALLKAYPEAEIVWTVRDVAIHRDEFPSQVRLVEYLSDEAMFEYATAAIWVCNIHLVPYLFKGLRKKEGQFFIQTWHGSLGIKKIENNSQLIRKAQNWLKMAELSSSYTDFWISNSNFETVVYKSAFWHVHDILEYGHPRNDILFGENKDIKEKVRNKLSIAEGTKTVLYVPTYRESDLTEKFEMDYQRVVHAFEERYDGEWKLLMRMHPKMREKAQKIVPKLTQVVDVSCYPDIQELMVFTDAMITDYSSCIFDFILTYKPGFIYAVNEQGYDSERGLYYPLSATPFSIAHSNTELEQNIRDFNPVEYHDKVVQFLTEKGCIDDGKASERVVQLITKLFRRLEE